MARKKTKPTPKANSELALSSFHARFEQLEQDHEWLLKQIKRKRSELTNFLEQMRSIAVEIVQRSRPFHERLVELDREIHSLFEEIFTTRKLGKQSRQKVEKVYRMLQMMQVISPKQDERDEDLEEDSTEEDFFENDENDSDFNSRFNSDRFDGEDNVPPNQDDSSSDLKQMRQTFLRLAATFHPDKVSNNENQQDYEEIMKEINRAYEEGDMARLLEIERQYQIDKSINLDNASKSEIERQCDRLEIDNKLLANQYENIKSELRWMRRTPEGEMVKEYRSLVKQGFDPIEEVTSMAEHQIQQVEAVRDFVADFRDKKISIKDFVKGPSFGQELTEEEIQEMMEELLFGGVTIR